MLRRRPACSWRAKCSIGRRPPAAICCRRASPPRSLPPRAFSRSCRCPDSRCRIDRIRPLGHTGTVTDPRKILHDVFRLLDLPRRSGGYRAIRPRRRGRARGDADRVRQIPLFSAPHAGARGPHPRGFAADRADARPGGGLAPFRRRGRKPELGQRSGGKPPGCRCGARRPDAPRSMRRPNGWRIPTPPNGSRVRA